MAKLEKRQYPRREAAWPVTMTTPQGTLEGETADISQTGVFIRCQEPLQPGEKFSLILKSPSDYPYKFSAQVVLSCTPRPNDEITPRGMGVMFLARMV